MARRLDVDSLRADPAVVVAGGQEWSVPEELSVPMMAELYVVENRIQSSVDQGVDETIKAVNEAHRTIEKLLGIPTDPETGMPTVQFSPKELLMIIGFAAGHEGGASAEIAETLTDSGQVADPETDTAEDREAEPGTEATPLRSAKPSSRRSSSSARSKGGRRGTGARSAGATSGSTPSTPSAVP